MGCGCARPFRAGGLRRSPRSSRKRSSAAISESTASRRPSCTVTASRARGYDLARYLALPDVGYPRSRGRIHGLALWLPPGSNPEQRQGARDAAVAIDALVGPGIEVQVELRGDEERPWAANPRRWRGPSTHWVTAFPVIHERRGVCRPCGSRPLVQPCRPARTRLLPVATHTPPSRRGRFGAGGSEPPRASRTSLLPCRNPLRGACRGTGRRRRRAAARGSGCACPSMNDAAMPHGATRRKHGPMRIPSLPAFAAFYRAINGPRSVPLAGPAGGIRREERTMARGDRSTDRTWQDGVS